MAVLSLEVDQRVRSPRIVCLYVTLHTCQVSISQPASQPCNAWGIVDSGMPKVQPAMLCCSWSLGAVRIV